MLKLVIFALSFAGISCITCKDGANNPVDWFIGLKLPRNSKNNNPDIRLGTAFMYITSGFSKQWLYSTVNDTKSPLRLTLQPLYQQPPDLYLLYNDEFPNNTKSFDRGHTKGIVFANQDSGVYLIHSVPKFPPKPSDGYSYPTTGLHFGQSFFCISFNSKFINEVGMQLLINDIFIYSARLAPSLQNIYPSFVPVIAGKPSKMLNNNVTMISKGGEMLTSFAKGPKFNQDLYSNYVAPTFKINMLAETWLNGAEPMTSECNLIYHVENVKVETSPILEYKSSLDHSKWAISKARDKPVVCIGDINRMKHQLVRGGGTMCIKDLNVWQLFDNIVGQVASC